MRDLPAQAVFTLRDLNRQPAKVLQAVRKFGTAEIRTRSGEVFSIVANTEKSAKRSARHLPNFRSRWKKLRELGHVPPPSSEDQCINRIIAGEE